GVGDAFFADDLRVAPLVLDRHPNAVHLLLEQPEIIRPRRVGQRDDGDDVQRHGVGIKVRLRFLSAEAAACAEPTLQPERSHSAACAKGARSSERSHPAACTKSAGGPTCTRGADTTACAEPAARAQCASAHRSKSANATDPWLPGLAARRAFNLRLLAKVHDQQYVIGRRETRRNQ